MLAVVININMPGWIILLIGTFVTFIIAAILEKCDVGCGSNLPIGPSFPIWLVVNLVLWFIYFIVT